MFYQPTISIFSTNSVIFEVICCSSYKSIELPEHPLSAVCSPVILRYLVGIFVITYCVIQNYITRVIHHIVK